ncbi:hypothetical protein [Macrococcoides bohemicum]|uniref:hypothetical protein n=1 Tax=Macrococcoides bohemicum TaxID=1903056 RepID=UPI00165DA224|nr:hypothetical protein [Macrococcus bohemicus]MBC9875608.1 hypothetical protein [Macrococcus bohemicus]
MMIVYAENENNTLSMLEYRKDTNGSLILENFTVKDLDNEEENMLYSIVKALQITAPEYYVNMNEMYPDETGKINLTLYPNPTYKGDLDYE